MRAQEFDQDLDEGWRDALAGLALGAGVALGAGAHTVKPGDTVYSIARANNTTPQEIARLNQLDRDFRIQPGQRLRLPPTAGAAKKAAPAPKPPAQKNAVRTYTGTRGEALVMQAARRAGIRDDVELAALLGQTNKESDGFRRLGEDLRYSTQGLMKTFPSVFRDAALAQRYAGRPQATANRVYANRLGNGDEASGDGWRYRGRGYIQLTGRENYRRAGQALKLPLERQPDMAAQPEIAAQIAVWYWRTRTQPRVRDFYDVDAVTSTINPAMRGMRARDQAFADHYHWLKDQRI